MNFLHDLYWIESSVDNVVFDWRPSEMAEVAARQIDESVRRFIEDSKIRIDKREPELILSAEHIVDNGINKAIVDQVCIHVQLKIMNNHFHLNLFMHRYEFTGTRHNYTCD